MVPSFCRLCGETLRPDEEDFHRYMNNGEPTWEACMRSAQGNYDRIIRVHHALGQSANPQAYD